VKPADTTASSLVELTRSLVQVPSCARRDPPEPILDLIAAWLRERGVESRLVRSGRGRVVGLAGEVAGGAGPVYLLNAPADTAPIGDPRTWSHPPTGAVVDGGWLYGRGSADSKSGVAILCHVLAAIASNGGTRAGTVAFLFDGDEHSAATAGVRRVVAGLRERGAVAGALVAYPGHDRIVTGCRGIYRCAIRVAGEAAHSGSSRGAGVNAIERAAALIDELARRSASLPVDPELGLPPKVTVTAARGGFGFSTVPDVCTLNVDVRLTTISGREWAQELLADAAAWLDGAHPAPRATAVIAKGHWPAYRLPPGSPLVAALQAAAQDVLGRELPCAQVGPSSIANVLSTLRVAATSGFGVAYRNLHAADECIDLSTLEPSFAVYLKAVELLLR